MHKTSNSYTETYVNILVMKNHGSKNMMLPQLNYPKDTAYAILGTGKPSEGGSVTDRNNSNEKTRPRK